MLVMHFCPLLSTLLDILIFSLTEHIKSEGLAGLALGVGGHAAVEATHVGADPGQREAGAAGDLGATPHPVHGGRGEAGGGAGEGGGGALLQTDCLLDQTWIT